MLIIKQKIFYLYTKMEVNETEENDEISSPK